MYLSNTFNVQDINCQSYITRLNHIILNNLYLVMCMLVGQWTIVI